MTDGFVKKVPVEVLAARGAVLGHEREEVRCSVSKAIRMATLIRQPTLFPLSRPFDNRDVTVDRQINNALDLAARLRPLDLDPVELRSLADAQNNAWVV